METCHTYTAEQRAEYERRFRHWVREHGLQQAILDKCNNTLGVKKGDMVVVLNGYGCPVGPYKVLGFDNCGAPSVYLDWDCFWCTKEIGSIVEINGNSINQ